MWTLTVYSTLLYYVIILIAVTIYIESVVVIIITSLCGRPFKWKLVFGQNVWRLRNRGCRNGSKRSLTYLVLLAQPRLLTTLSSSSSSSSWRRRREKSQKFSIVIIIILHVYIYICISDLSSNAWRVCFLFTYVVFSRVIVVCMLTRVASAVVCLVVRIEQILFVLVYFCCCYYGTSFIFLKAR